MIDINNNIIELFNQNLRIFEIEVECGVERPNLPSDRRKLFVKIEKVQKKIKKLAKIEKKIEQNQTDVPDKYFTNLNINLLPFASMSEERDFSSGNHPENEQFPSLSSISSPILPSTPREIISIPRNGHSNSKERDLLNLRELTSKSTQSPLVTPRGSLQYRVNTPKVVASPRDVSKNYPEPELNREGQDFLNLNNLDTIKVVCNSMTPKSPRRRTYSHDMSFIQIRRNGDL